MSKFPIPDDAMDDRLAILGTAGSGKTYLTTTAIERLLTGGARVVGVDPLGVMWGLRLKADGKTPSSFNVVIFGGRHGDLPLTEHAGALIGETVATMRESCIIDLSELPTKAAERRFMTAFLEAIYRNTDPTKVDPYHLIIDEADRFAPQKPPAGDETMLNRMEEIVRRGRVKGFIPWMITQRPAVLNKNVLSQADGLVLLKLTSSQDRDQVGAWIEGQADKAQGKAILGSLPAMQRGQGVVWIPGRGILETVQFPKKTTFDSSSAPKRGEKRTANELKPLDVGKLKDRLATVEAETKASDPKALKAALAGAQAELAQLRKLPAVSNVLPKSNVPDQKTLAAAREEGAQGVRETVPAMLDVQHAASFQAGFEFLAARRAVFERDLVPARKPLSAITAALKAKTPARTSTAPIQAAQPKPITAVKSAGGAGSLDGPLQRIVDAIRYWNVFGLPEPTHHQVAFIANYVPGSGTWNRYLSALRSQGMLEPKGALRLTENGVAEAHEPEIAPTGAQLRADVLGKIDGPLVKILRPLIDTYPNGMDHQSLANAAGYVAGSGTWNRYLSGLRSLDLIEKRGELKAQSWLFPEGR